MLKSLRIVLGLVAFAIATPAPAQISNPFFPDASFCATQGAIATRKATGWGCLTPGTSGQLLQTGGPAADASWISAGGSGTVTSVGVSVPAFFAVSGSPITGSGTIAISASSQAQKTFLSGPTSGANAVPTFRTFALTDIPAMATGSLLGNITGGSATPTAITPTAILDSAFGSAQGSVLYRNSTGWVVLAPGTSGQFLKTNGAAANPAWSGVSGANGGTVTSVATGTGLTGGTITTTGTISGVAMVGATSGVAGTLGMVPAPSAGDQDKVLTGAGTWATAGGFGGISVTTYTSGSGTYTTPAGATTLRIRMVGGGGGGGGTDNNGSAGGTSSFGTALLSATGGAGAGSDGLYYLAPLGGTSSGCTINVTGSRGTQSAEAEAVVQGMDNGGANSPFGAGGNGLKTGATTSGNAASGYGAGGGGATHVTGKWSGGGAAGGYCEHFISTPGASYSYSIGSGGAGGGSTASGGAGSGGFIIVEAF